jgi:hypothetical protein
MNLHLFPSRPFRPVGEATAECRSCGATDLQAGLFVAETEVAAHAMRQPITGHFCADCATYAPAFHAADTGALEL